MGDQTPTLTLKVKEIQSDYTICIGVYNNKLCVIIVVSIPKKNNGTALVK